MRRFEKNGLQWLTFHFLDNHRAVTQATLLRHGGCSMEPFRGLNLACDVGDDPDHVAHNLRLVEETLQIPRFVTAKQTHGVRVAVATVKGPDQFPDCDALITNTPGVALMIQHADCQAVVIYDPQNGAIANVHAGWKGNVRGIFAEVINKMVSLYHSRPADLLVGISPSLGPNAAQFIHYHKEFPSSFWPYAHKPGYFDLWAISRMQLMECGILPDHIEIAELCTYSHPEDYFSYRRTKPITGRHGTFVMLK